MALHENLAKTNEFLGSEGLGQQIRHVVVSGDEVNGDETRQDVLADGLDPHVEVLDAVIGLEGLEDHGCTAVVTVYLDRQLLFSAKEARQIQDVQ